MIIRRPTPSRAGSLAAILLLGATVAMAPPLRATEPAYANPLAPAVPGDGIVESCADPSVMYGAEGEGRWYMYCTTDPLNDEDRDSAGNFRFHFAMAPAPSPSG